MCTVVSTRTERELAIEQPGPKSDRHSIWRALQQLVYRLTIRDLDLDRLKEVLTSCMEQIGQDLIDEAIDQWLIRISLLCELKGTHLTSFGLSGPSVMREKYCFKRLYDANAITTCLFAFVLLRI